MEEMAQAALDKGMYAIGFSSHSTMPFECGWTMRGAPIDVYLAEAARVRELFVGKLDVLAGLELDYHSDVPIDGLDYVVSSTHFVLKDGDYLPVDESGARISADADKYYGGDVFGYIRDFYEDVSHLADRGPCVIGHFDLVTKFNEGGCMFDESDPRYIGPATDALEALAKKDVVFEINTGAIYRGSRLSPYPSAVLLGRIAELGGRVILASDAHCTDAIAYKFDEAAEYAAAAGIKNIEKYPPKFVPAK